MFHGTASYKPSPDSYIAEYINSAMGVFIHDCYDSIPNHISTSLLDLLEHYKHSLYL